MPNAGTVTGFDFGTRRIGVAIGQTVTRTASPLATLASHKDGEPDWKAIDKIIADWKPVALIVGLPLNMDGTTQKITESANQFAEALHKRYALPVHMADERLSSVAAREEVFAKGGYRALRKKPVDSLAAKIILEDWLQQNS